MTDEDPDQSRARSVRSPLERAEIASTASWLASVQRDDGLIPWWPGGPADPWNHVEAAMALDVARRHREARAGYEHLFGRQRRDGAVPADLVDVTGSRIDTNAVAYLAVGLFHHVISTGDLAYGARRFLGVERAIEFVLAHELADGAIAWEVDAHGRTSDRALIAGSSSIVLSLRCAVALGQALGVDRPRWQAAARSLAAAVRGAGRAFFDNSHFAMDAYYPVIAGVVAGAAATAALADARSRFATDDGVRCRSDRRWVTTAESAELAIAHALVGDDDVARVLLSTTGDKRRRSGGYLTGIVYPERTEFPPGEETTYSAAAVVLAADLLAGGRATAAVFDPFRTSARRLPTAQSGSSVNSPDAIASR